MRPLEITFIGPEFPVVEVSVEELLDAELRRGQIRVIARRQEDYIDALARMLSDARRIRQADVSVAVVRHGMDAAERELMALHLGYAAALSKRILLLDVSGGFSPSEDVPLALGLVNWRVTSERATIELLREFWLDLVVNAK